ncbi:MAG: PmeII family type II restriction endonuclease [Syntrophales bacterium]|nr:PmeII family type II restriction endonuclease [Syntrophales bacterium]
MFGDFLEGLAIHINKTVFNGNKSAAEGIDLEFNSDGVKYIISIKSGPNWGNYSQIQKMKDNFNKAKRILRTSNSKMNIIAVNGCCYGVDNQPDKGEYQKLCGQRFWQFMSGDESLFTQIIEPLGHEARERNEEFLEFYAQIITKFTCSFAERFCNDGKIDWERLVIFNSGNKK